MATARGAARVVTAARYGRLRLESIELPGRPERLLVIRGFAAHVPPALALRVVKDFYWGRDPEDEDVRWLTQWQYIDWRSLDALMGCDAFGAHVRTFVDRGGFGQLRWYGASHETSRHSDGFDGICATTGRPVLGRTRFLLRLGGSGFLNLHWERPGGRAGGARLVLSHGDLALMGRGISGTRPSGRQRLRRLTVTHRAGGLAAMHAPRPVDVVAARSFVTLVWTTREARAAFLRFFRNELLETLLAKPLAPFGGELHRWPRDPDEMADVIEHEALLPWDVGLTLADRQAPKRLRSRASPAGFRCGPRWQNGDTLR